jgi:hypothetical protein
MLSHGFGGDRGGRRPNPERRCLKDDTCGEAKRIFDVSDEHSRKRNKSSHSDWSNLRKFLSDGPNRRQAFGQLSDGLSRGTSNHWVVSE